MDGEEDTVNTEEVGGWAAILFALVAGAGREKNSNLLVAYLFGPTTTCMHVACNHKVSRRRKSPTMVKTALVYQTCTRHVTESINKQNGSNHG